MLTLVSLAVTVSSCLQGATCLHGVRCGGAQCRGAESEVWGATCGDWGCRVRGSGVVRRGATWAGAAGGQLLEPGHGWAGGAAGQLRQGPGAGAAPGVGHRVARHHRQAGQLRARHRPGPLCYHPGGRCCHASKASPPGTVPCGADYHSAGFARLRGSSLASLHHLGALLL